MSELRQEINLYHPMFRREAINFGLRSVAMILVSVAAGLAVVSGYALYQKSGLETALASLESQQSEVRNKLTTMNQMAPAAEPDPNLVSRERSLLEAQKEASRLMAQLSGSEPTARDGFTPYLTGLARRPVEGLWLNRVEIESGGRNLALGGETVRPELVLKFLRALRHEDAYSGHEFATAVVRRSKAGAEGRETLRFELRSKETADDGSG